VLVAALLVAGSWGPAASAADDPTEGGLWYLSVTGATAAHEQTTGSGIIVAVLDGPINPNAPALVGAPLATLPEGFCDNADGTPMPGVGTTEASEHASNMVAMIIGTGAGAGGVPGVRGVAPGATVRHYAAVNAETEMCFGSKSGSAMDRAIADGAKIISMSSSSPVKRSDNLAEVARAERAGAIVVAASNNRGGTELGWPASANGVVSVEAADVNGQLMAGDAVTSPALAVVAPGVDILKNSWSGGAWDTYMLGSGSSYATAWTSGALALVWSAHPDATANQVIQTLLRNTSTGAGELTRNDSWGYGTVSLGNMLKADPSSYPDVNPLVRTDPAAEPAAADLVGGAATGGSTTGPVNEPTDASAVGTGTGFSIASLALVAGGVLALIALVGGVIAFVLIRRRRTGPVHRPANL